VVWEAIYQPFGEIDRYLNAKVSNYFRFPGQYEDELTGVYYNIYRYYIPHLGRYNRVDPILYTWLYQQGNFSNLSVSFYVYSKANPILKIDPKGLITECHSGRCPDCESGIWRPWYYILPNYVEGQVGGGLPQFSIGGSGAIFKVLCTSNPDVSASIFTFCFDLAISSGFWASITAGWIVCFGECCEDLAGVSVGFTAGSGVGLSLGGGGNTSGCIYASGGLGVGAYFAGEFCYSKLLSCE